jgi:PEP-CTERM motif
LTFQTRIPSANSYWNYQTGEDISPTFSSAGISFAAAGDNLDVGMRLNMPSTDGTVPLNFSDNFNAQISYDFTSSDGAIYFFVGDIELGYAEYDVGDAGEISTGVTQEIYFGNTGTMDINVENGFYTESINGTTLFTGNDTSDVTELLISAYPSSGGTLTLSNFSVESTPEPGTFALAGLSGLGLMIMKKKFSKSK